MQYSDDESSIEEQSFKEEDLDEDFENLDDLEADELGNWGSDGSDSEEEY